MVYLDFTGSITDKHGITIENWPLPVLTAPCKVQCKKDLEVLYNSWFSGATYFRRFSQEEFDQWKAARLELHTQSTSTDMATPAATPEDPDTTMTDQSPAPTSEDSHVNMAGQLATPPSTQVSTAGTGGPSNSTITQPPMQPPQGGPSTMTGVMRINAMRLIVPRQPRKERSDKGKKRGPRRARGAAPSLEE